jgi:hypothetical protein
MRETSGSPNLVTLGRVSARINPKAAARPGP